MASSLALWRATATAAAPSGLLSRLTNPLRAASVAPRVARSLIIGSEMRRYDNDDSEDDEDDEDVFDPPTQSLSQVVNLMDQFMGTGAAGSRRGWDVKEDDSVLCLRLDMPGLGREDVKVSVEQNTLTIKGEGEVELEGSRRRYSSRLNLPLNLYKLGEIKAVMKNGVLKVVVPKVKEDVLQDDMPVR